MSSLASVAICAGCWKELSPGRIPVRVVGAPIELCDECGTATTSGIYVRRIPKRPKEKPSA